MIHTTPFVGQIHTLPQHVQPGTKEAASAPMNTICKPRRTIKETLHDEQDQPDKMTLASCKMNLQNELERLTLQQLRPPAVQLGP